MLRRLASVRAQRWSSEIHRYLLCYCVCRCWRRSSEDVIVNALCATDASVHPAAADDADITAFDRSDDHTADDKGWIMSMRHMSSIKHRTNTASRIFFIPDDGSDYAMLTVLSACLSVSWISLKVVIRFLRNLLSWWRLGLGQVSRPREGIPRETYFLINPRTLWHRAIKFGAIAHHGRGKFLRGRPLRSTRDHRVGSCVVVVGECEICVLTSAVLVSILPPSRRGVIGLCFTETKY